MMPASYHRERRLMLIGLGLCSKCGRVEPREGAKECAECLQKRREAMQKAREAR